jgi:hypothetical protein
VSFRRLLLTVFAAMLAAVVYLRRDQTKDVLLRLWAYLAETLSDAQDGVANEAYLDTARKRRSVRRHARLLDQSPEPEKGDERA